MVGVVTTSHHRLWVYSPPGFQTPLPARHAYTRGVWWNVGEVRIGNTLRASRWIQIDNRHDTGQVQFASSRPPYQSATEIVQTTPRRNRAHAVGVHYYGDQVKHKSNCWYLQTNWAPGRKKDSIYCRVSEPFSINRCYKVGCYGMWSMPIHWPGARALTEREAGGEKKLTDITHYGSKHFLTLINCGPSQFVLLWQLCQQDSASVIWQSELILYGQGPSIELLANSDTALGSTLVISIRLCTCWKWHCRKESPKH